MKSFNMAFSKIERLSYCQHAQCLWFCSTLGNYAEAKYSDLYLYEKTINERLNKEGKMKEMCI